MLKRICHTRQLPLALLISAVATLGSDGALAQSAGLTLSQVGAPNTTTSCASGQPFCAITITDTFSYSNASPITFSAGNALSATLSFSNPLTIYGTSILNPTGLYIDFPATYSPINNTLNYSETLSFSDNGNLVSVPFLTYLGGSGGSFLVFGAENYSGPNITIDSLTITATDTSLVSATLPAASSSVSVIELVYPPVLEPSSYALMVSGLVGLGFYVRKRDRRTVR